MRRTVLALAMVATPLMLGGCFGRPDGPPVGPGQAGLVPGVMPDLADDQRADKPQRGTLSTVRGGDAGILDESAAERAARRRALAKLKRDLVKPDSATPATPAADR